MGAGKVGSRIAPGRVGSTDVGKALNGGGVSDIGIMVLAALTPTGHYFILHG